MPIKIHQHIQSSRGFSMPEALMSVFLILVIAGSVLSTFKYQLNNYTENQNYMSVADLRRSILATVSHQESWNITKSKNSSMACARTFPSTCSANVEREIDVYRSTGSLYVGSLDPKNGFTRKGTPCNTFGTSNSSCIFKARVFWKNACNSAIGCKYPDEQVTINFYIAPHVKSIYASAGNHLRSFDVISYSRNNFGLNNSPVVNCLAKNLSVFIGFGKSFLNPQGQLAMADGDGCVNISSFQGPAGDRGPAGLGGFTGSQGPRGLDGTLSFLPPPTPTPTPTPAPTPQPTPPLKPIPCYGLVPLEAVMAHKKAHHLPDHAYRWCQGDAGDGGGGGAGGS